MEYQNYKDIKLGTVDETEFYIEQLISNGLSSEIAYNIIYFLRECPANNLPHVEPNVFSFIRKFLIENHDTYNFQVEEIKVLNDIDCIIKIWGPENSAYFFVSNEQKDILISDSVLLLSGVVPDISDIANIDLNYIREHDNFSDNLKFISLLKIIDDKDLGLLPLNSDSIKVPENTSRFSSAVWFEAIQQKTIILAGVGGIGSYVGFLLARMNPKSLFVYDPDIVETANMSGQLYGIEDVGNKKVEALSKMVKNYALYNSFFAISEKFELNSEPNDIMICGFDNMSARKLFFHKWLDHLETVDKKERNKCLFIDGRLAAEELQVLCIRGDDTFNIKRYAEEFLFDSAEADTTICSYKQTTYMANMIGSIIVNLFTNFVANEIVEGLRDLPFFTTYSADSMIFKTEN